MEEVISWGHLSLAITGGLATLSLNDPERLNALTAEMAADMVRAFAEVMKPRRRIRALLIVGAGRGFCAGVNLMAEAKAVAGGAGKVPAIGSVEALFHPMLRRLGSLPIPVVAAVQGPCVGIGLGIVLAADYVIASEDAYFMVPFRNLASAPDSGSTWLLPRLVGLQRARRMILRAERVSARTALDWGLISELAPAEAFADAARAIAAELADGPTLALGEMKRLLNDGLHQELDSAMEAEVRAVARTSRSRDNVAAMRVFGTKTKPDFTGE